MLYMFPRLSVLVECKNNFLAPIISSILSSVTTLRRAVSHLSCFYFEENEFDCHSHHVCQMNSSDGTVLNQMSFFLFFYPQSYKDINMR